MCDGPDFHVGPTACHVNDKSKDPKWVRTNCSGGGDIPSRIMDTSKLISVTHTCLTQGFKIKELIILNKQVQLIINAEMIELNYYLCVCDINIGDWCPLVVVNNTNCHTCCGTTHSHKTVTTTRQNHST